MADTTKLRYSDEELEEFRALINEKMARAQSEYDNIVDSLDSDLTREEEMNAKMLAQRQSDFIKKLQAALERIDNKTYGICRVTGKLIPKDRLRAVPHTTLSMEAKNK